MTPRRRATDPNPVRKGFWVGEKQIGTWAQALVSGLVLTALGWAGTQFFEFYKANAASVVDKADQAAIAAAVQRATDAKFTAIDQQLLSIGKLLDERERRIEALEHAAYQCKVHP